MKTAKVISYVIAIAISGLLTCRAEAFTAESQKKFRFSYPSAPAQSSSREIRIRYEPDEHSKHRRRVPPGKAHRGAVFSQGRTQAEAQPSRRVNGFGFRNRPSSGVRTRHIHYCVASWYGPKFHGRQAASGEKFNMYERTAAHRNLPFGTRVKVTNLRNGRHTVVRINDRGPFVKGREIDLSYGAARELGMLESGIERVRLEILSS